MTRIKKVSDTKYAETVTDLDNSVHEHHRLYLQYGQDFLPPYYFSFLSFSLYDCVSLSLFVCSFSFSVSYFFLFPVFFLSVFPSFFIHNTAIK